MCLRVLTESNRIRFDSYSRQEQCIDHIPYYVSGLVRAHFSDYLSRNSCISSEKMAGVFTTNVLGFLTVTHVDKSWEQQRRRR